MKTPSKNELKLSKKSTDSTGWGATATVIPGILEETRQGHKAGEARIIRKIMHDKGDIQEERDAARIIFEAGLRDHPNLAYIYGFTENADGTTEIVFSQYKELPPLLRNGQEFPGDEKVSQNEEMEMRKALVTGIASITEAMVEQGIRHNDGHGGNFMYEEKKDNTISIRMIDFGMITQHTDDKNAQLGFVDYDRRMAYYRKQIEKDRQGITDPNSRLVQITDPKIFLDTFLAAPLDSSDFSYFSRENNPIVRIQKNLEGLAFSAHNLQDQEVITSLDDKCENIMREEMKLLRIHAVMDYMRNQNIDNSNAIESALLEEFEKGKTKGELEQMAREIAGEIRKEGEALFEEIKTSQYLKQ